MFYPERGISAAFRASALAFVVGLVGAACASQPSLAVTLTIDGSGTPYEESGFNIVPIRIVNGNCDGASGKPCLALNSGEISQLSKVGGGAFNLLGFGFEFEGQPSELTVTAFSGTTLIQTLVYGDPTFPDKNVWYTVLPGINNITSIIFDDTGTGNIRIDDLIISLACDTSVPGACQQNENPPGTPIPGAVWLFGTVLAGGAGYGRWRKKRKAQLATAA